MESRSVYIELRYLRMSFAVRSIGYFVYTRLGLVNYANTSNRPS